MGDYDERPFPPPPLPRPSWRDDARAAEGQKGRYDPPSYVCKKSEIAIR